LNRLWADMDDMHFAAYFKERDSDEQATQLVWDLS
jgi:hypothetical protein